mmetsp:Transcript_76312/g.247535  ORF Transcript_76312/g.247535 Transcript_76312/m.247535 type:complete len:249 (-) Transcript_76312:1865-2611(-)
MRANSGFSLHPLAQGLNFHLVHLVHILRSTLLWQRYDVRVDGFMSVFSRLSSHIGISIPASLLLQVKSQNVSSGTLLASHFRLLHTLPLGLRAWSVRPHQRKMRVLLAGCRCRRSYLTARLCLRGSRALLHLLQVAHCGLDLHSPRPPPGHIVFVRHSVVGLLRIHRCLLRECARFPCRRSCRTLHQANGRHISNLPRGLRKPLLGRPKVLCDHATHSRLRTDRRLEHAAAARCDVTAALADPDAQQG